MKNYPYLCYVEIDDAASRKQAPDKNGGEIRSRLLFYIKSFIFHDSKN